MFSLYHDGMQVYTVIPIAKGIPKETLTYFGPDDISLGSLVSIPLRKKMAHAIVIDSQSVPTNKAEIKSSVFSLKKIGKVINKHFLPPAFLTSAHKTADFYATTTGAVMQSVIPKLILEHASKISVTQSVARSPVKKETLTIQDTEDDRFAHYKSFIRGEFAKQSSVYFCLPTIEDIKQWKFLLEKGIEQYTCVLHSDLSKKEFEKAVALIQSSTHPILIIGTAPFLSLIRPDLGSIILDRENSRSYRTLSRPYIDMRVFVKNLAQAMGVKLILGDLLLSVESIWKQKNDEYAELSPLKFRQLTSAEHLLVDMKLPKGEYTEEFRMVSKELEALIDKTTQENENLFIFCGRKGLSPITVCGDCGLVVTCTECHAPVTLYRRKEENIFLCNKCGEERGTSERCKHCDSWKLETLGIGVEGVEDEIKKRFPEATVLRMDKDNASTPKKAAVIMAKFESTPGAILIGTEMALYYLNKSIENVAVASIDALFSLPDFRINEKIFYLLLTMRSHASKVFLIQTRNGDERIFDYALKGNLIDFYRQEIDERKKFTYPPFSLFVKFTVEGKLSAIQKEIEHLCEVFAQWNPAPFESLHASSRGNAVLHVLFRFPTSAWPDPKFLEIVKSLPPQILVRVDPESIIG